MGNLKSIREVIGAVLDIRDILLLIIPIGGSSMIVGAYYWIQDNVPLISRIYFLVGFGIIIVPLLVFAFYRFRRKVKRYTEKPETFVFSYIRSVNASALQNGENYLSVHYCCPSALPYDLTFMRTNCKLLINGSPMEEIGLLRPLKISKQCFNEVTNIHIPLTPSVVDIIRDGVKRSDPIRVELEVTAWDDNKNRHDLTAKECTMVFLK